MTAACIGLRSAASGIAVPRLGEAGPRRAADVDAADAAPGRRPGLAPGLGRADGGGAEQLRERAAEDSPARPGSPAFFLAPAADAGPDAGFATLPDDAFGSGVFSRAPCSSPSARGPRSSRVATAARLGGGAMKLQLAARRRGCPPRAAAAGPAAA